ncbi:hypothetical protein Adt_39800 [Abeliophyllum distichum]|uniref:Uncharacterized protein n=1 Tax=Abeliophyllum distichum TaxID=126358 RepID=A0ABD1Q638_9LAMI
MNLIRGLVLTKEVYNILEGFDGKLNKEEANSKKLSEDLKAMSLEKAQMESDKRFLQIRLDSVVAKETDLKAKYEVKLQDVKECLKKAQDQKRATEASQKCTEEAQNLAEERAFVDETTVATANNFEAIFFEKDKQLAEVKEQVERVKADRTDAEARIVMAYQKEFESTFEYIELAHKFMTACGQHLVERIEEIHLEWDISFLRRPLAREPPPDDLPTSEDHAVAKVSSIVEPHGTGEA